MRLSIRYKILGVVGLLLLVAVCFYTLLASSIFKQEKIALLYDINHSVAVNVAAQLRSSLIQIGEQMKLHLISQLLSKKDGSIRLSSSHLKEANIKAIDIFEKNANDFRKIPDGTSQTLDDDPQLTSHLKDAQSNGYAFWNMLGDSGLPRYFLAVKVEVNLAGKPGVYLAVAELESKPFYQPLQLANLFQSYFVKPNGEVLIHCVRSSILPHGSIQEHPIITRLKEHPTSGVMAFQHAGEHWVGAYAPVGIANLYFLSQANQTEIHAALVVLIRRSILFGLIVITATFLVSILFSKRLTRNLQLLTQNTQRIGQGDLSTQIDIRSGDEIQELASSFNWMVNALRASREAIEKYNRELENKVAERTQELKEKNIAIKEIQETLLKTAQLAAVGEVAGRTAHEVLNPLTGIMARLECSTRFLRSPEQSNLPHHLTDILKAWESEYQQGGAQKLISSLQQRSFVNPEFSLFEEDLENLKKLSQYWQSQLATLDTDVDFVQFQVQRIHRIVNSMREMMRTSSTKAPVHCHEALRDAILTMTDFLSKDGITLQEDFSAGEDLAVVNRDELIQIIMNLIRNAYQAITIRDDLSAGTGHIMLRTVNKEAFVCIEIIDNGAGIPQDKHQDIFEIGFTTKPPSEGTGMGLSIARRYARAFGGEVELVFSEPKGRGTCFRITIPLRDAKDLAA